MAIGGSAAYSGEGEDERQLLEGELHDAECTLLGEVQQIERLAQENNSKVRAPKLSWPVDYASHHVEGWGGALTTKSYVARQIHR